MGLFLSRRERGTGAAGGEVVSARGDDDVVDDGGKVRQNVTRRDAQDLNALGTEPRVSFLIPLRLISTRMRFAVHFNG